jgi:acyl transferase domain-containing protein
MGSLPDGVLIQEQGPGPGKTMPIVIMGIKFRGPGDATAIEGFYNLIAEAREVWSPIPKNRWNGEAFYHPDPDRNATVSKILYSPLTIISDMSKSNVSGGHFFKHDLSKFDARFLSMTNAEAAVRWVSIFEQPSLTLSAT